MCRVVVFVMIGRLAVAAREIAMAWRFGTGELIDAYLIVTTMINWLPLVWSGVLAVVYVPLVARFEVASGIAEARRFVSELTGATILISFFLAGAAAILFPLLLPIVAPTIDPATASWALQLATPLSMLLLTGMVAGLMISVLSARERHVGTLSEGVPALFISIVIGISWLSDVSVLLYGALIGALAQVCLLVWSANRAALIDRPVIVPRSEAWPIFWRGMGVLAAGQAAMSLINLIDPLMASAFGSGSVASLGYAQRMIGMLTAVGAIAVARAVLPVLSSRVASGAVNDADRIARKWAAVSFAGGLAIAVIGWFAAPWATEMLFERGAFGPNQTAAVASLVRAGLPQLPFYFAGVVLVQSLASRGRHAVIAAVAFVNLIVKVGANAWLAPSIGVEGLMLATAVMYAFSFVALALVVRMSPSSSADTR
jgi:peptidoglycan biosynthesis protein MviN/MurJ (putative lipid II flippase)